MAVIAESSPLLRPGCVATGRRLPQDSRPSERRLPKVRASVHHPSRQPEREGRAYEAGRGRGRHSVDGWNQAARGGHIAQASVGRDRAVGTCNRGVMKNPGWQGGVNQWPLHG